MTGLPGYLGLFFRSPAHRNHSQVYIIVLSLEQQIPRIHATNTGQSRIFVHGDVVTAVLLNKEQAPNNACASLATAVYDWSIVACWKS